MIPSLKNHLPTHTREKKRRKKRKLPETKSQSARAKQRRATHEIGGYGEKKLTPPVWGHVQGGCASTSPGTAAGSVKSLLGRRVCPARAGAGGRWERSACYIRAGQILPSVRDRGCWGAASQVRNLLKKQHCRTVRNLSLDRDESIVWIWLAHWVSGAGVG